MSISTSENTNTTSSESSKNKSFRTAITVIAVTIILAACFTVLMCYFLGDFSASGGLVLTFWVSFLIGLGGAGVYLVLLLLVEKNLDILKNDVLKNQQIMSFFFLLSGGFVAAITQVSTGVLLAGGIQAVFMVGFGWLGALSGVAFTKQQAKLSEEKKELSEAKEERETILASTDDQLIGAKEAWNQEKQELLAAVADLRKKLRAASGNTTGGS